jgi:Mu-like prophage major head subunit gpT
MAGIINSASFAKALWPGVNAWYGKAYDEYPVEWDKLFEKFTSRKQYEEDVGISSFGLAVIKPEGSPITYDSEQQTFTTRYTHIVYALGFIITREIMEDDQYDVVGQRKAQGLAFSIRQTKEVVGANVYNRAFNSSYVGGDGVSLISASHPLFAGGTFSNQISTAADLSEAALEQACIDIANFTNDRGLRIAVRPESLILPIQLEFEAERILKTERRVGTDNNDINALRQTGRFPKGFILNHYFTNPLAWFIRTDVQNGMKFFERRGDEFEMDNDFDTENARFKATSRYSFGWTDPRALYASPGV